LIFASTQYYSTTQCDMDSKFNGSHGRHPAVTEQRGVLAKPPGRGVAVAVGMVGRSGWLKKTHERNSSEIHGHMRM